MKVKYLKYLLAALSSTNSSNQNNFYKQLKEIDKYINHIALKGITNISEEVSKFHKQLSFPFVSFYDFFENCECKKEKIDKNIEKIILINTLSYLFKKNNENQKDFENKLKLIYKIYKKYEFGTLNNKVNITKIERSVSLDKSIFILILEKKLKDFHTNVFFRFCLSYEKFRDICFKKMNPVMAEEINFKNGVVENGLSIKDEFNILELYNLCNKNLDKISLSFDVNRNLDILTINSELIDFFKNDNRVVIDIKDFA